MSQFPIKLNKYVAHSGLCSRRKAVELIKSGQIQVNGKTINIPYHEVYEKDVISHKGKTLKIQQKYIYYLLNKPRGYITTVCDEKDRRTVMDLIPEPKYGLHPVGRLDRATTGLLIITNDGEFTYKLTHPKFEMVKIYEVKLDRILTETEVEKIRNGVILEDGFIKPDAVNFVRNKKHNKIQIKLHSGKNRIVRRIFESQGFEVKALDRIVLASLTKKGLPLGKIRQLKSHEINILKHLS